MESLSASSHGSFAAAHCLHRVEELFKEEHPLQLGVLSRAGDSSSAPLQVHPFGSVIVEEQRLQFREDIDKLRGVVLQFKDWIVNEKEVLVKRYLKLLKDQLALDGTNLQLQRGFSGCQQLVTTYLQHSAVQPTHLALLLQLQELAEELHLERDVEETDSMMGGEGPTTTVSLSSHSVLIDVVLTNRGEVVDVKLSFTGQTQRDEYDRELTASLRKGISYFKEKVKKLIHQDNLIRANTALNLSKLADIMHEDYTMIAEFEKKQYPEKQCLLYHHGLLKHSCEGVTVVCYASAATLLQADTSDTDALMEAGAQNLLIQFEQGSQEEPVQLPIASQITSVDTNGLNFSSIPPDAPSVPIHFVFMLRPTLVASSETMRRIFSVINGPKEHRPLLAEVKRSDSLQEILAQKQDLLECCVNVEGMAQKYIHCGSYSDVLLVNRIPFVHISQVKNILQILRQQLVFNEIFTSCYASPFLLPAETNLQSSGATVLELMSKPPYSISVTFLHPVSQNLVCLVVHVDLNGIVNIIMHHNPKDEPPCSNQYATDVLNTCKSIPLTIYSIFQQHKS